MKRMLELLGDGRFHSGEEIGAALGVSRSAVWKCLKQLEARYGIQLFKVHGRGYRLADPVSLLDQDRITSMADRLGWSLWIRDTVDSTNADALRLLQGGANAPFLVLAEHQTSGRGRRGRVWVSPPAQNIYYTLALKISNGSQGLTGLSLVVGLAVLEALRRTGVEKAGLKWPNDIYADGAKVAGILLELSGDPADICHVVIGIGINVNMTSSAGDIDQPWTSIKSQIGSLVDRSGLVNILSESLHQYLAIHAREGFGALRDEWQRNNMWQGRRCTLSAGNLQVKGVMIGINEQGALRLMTDDHKEQCFSGGELSLRVEHDS